jgi:large subunit ribosomal protein L9e
MKHILASRDVVIPEGGELSECMQIRGLLHNNIEFPPIAVTIECGGRTIIVKGPKGTLKREFKAVNFAVEMRGKRSLRVDMWFGNRAERACLRTICTHIENMITGITKGFTYKMRFAYAHFPINITLAKDTATTNHVVEIRNFLGERRLRRVVLHPGVGITRSDNVKDELVLTGNDLEKVSSSAALLHESCLVRNKDIRKFLDGVYVSEKGRTGKLVSVV